MTDHTGGTVTYYRADWNDDKRRWEVRFTLTGGIFYFSPAEGGAMGLTVPEPAPLVVECNGHSIELSDEEVELAELVWSAYDDDQSSFDHAPLNRVKHKIAGLLRDARQDPQPASHDLDRHEREMCDVLKERDDAQEWADKLAFALGGPAIGEHSSMNNPWQNALDNPLQPAPLSPGECLRGLLAGRDDADELMAHAANESPNPLLMRALGDAARGGA